MTGPRVPSGEKEAFTVPLFITDGHGHRGHITDEFSVEYDGPLAIGEYVDGVVTETTPAEAVVEELVIGLVQDLGVTEVRRAESSVDPPGPR